MDKYLRYTELRRSETEGIDYNKIVRDIPGASVVVIAPHAGAIEPMTGSIAQDIAGSEYSFYCFCGLKKANNRDLHITSHNFDEPECVKLISVHQWVVAIHGCKEQGERIFLGGLDNELILDLVMQLKLVGIDAETSGHKYLGENPQNICNRGKSNAGVQFELSRSFREGPNVHAFVKAVRQVFTAR